MRKMIAVSAALAAGLFGTGKAMASQTQVAFAEPVSVRSTIDPNEYEAKAKDLFAQPKRYDEAIKLFLKAAETRDVGDPMRVQDVIMASRLSYYRQDFSRARSLMVRAADEAAATGDVITAAHSYVDAAFLARQAGEPENIEPLVRKAEMLAASPLIDRADRNGILVRIKSNS
jgi:hypothetical protein